MRRVIFCLLIALSLPGLALADGVKSYPFDGEFDDAAFGVESAIVDRGLVVDYVSHVGEMLKRTKDDVGGSKALFANANVYLFCSAVLSRKMMEANAENIAHCPYGIFVTEGIDGTVQIGYRQMPQGPMKEVEALLEAIVQEAISD